MIVSQGAGGDEKPTTISTKSEPPAMVNLPTQNLNIGNIASTSQQPSLSPNIKYQVMGNLESNKASAQLSPAFVSTIVPPRATAVDPTTLAQPAIVNPGEMMFVLHTLCTLLIPLVGNVFLTRQVE